MTSELKKMTPINKEKPIERVSASHAVKRNSAHERTSSVLLSSQQAIHKKSSLPKHPLPPQLLRRLVAKLVSLLRGSAHQQNPKNRY